MRLGNQKNRLKDWSDCVAVEKRSYEMKTGEVPDSVSVDQETYLDICAAAGSLIKQVHGLHVYVRWGKQRV